MLLSGAALSSSAVPAPLPASAVLPHLEPIVGDPLVLDLRGFTGVDIGTTAMDVLPFPVRQAYDESYAAPRYLVITPTTVAGVAPHPTRLGFGLLKWERSLLSLVSIVAQPLFRPLVGGSQRGAVSAAAAAVGASRLLEADAVAIDAAGSSTEEGAATVESLPYDISAPEAADTPTVAKKLLGMLSRGSPAAAAAAPRGFLMYGTALLLSFAPEVPETLALLRTVRAGLRPVQRGGWLLKRKRSERREYPLLGALAWKRRWFVLEPLLLRYYAQSSDGCAPKGTIPFSGWVEVARTGVAGAAAHAHAFVVRTGSTSHVFQAPSDEDADAWVTAIAVNAQWAGFMLDAPQSIIARSHADAEVLATALHSRRNELCANASGVGAAGVGASAAGAAVAAWVQQCGQGDGSGGGPTGADASVAPLELDLSASAIMADAARSRVREPGLSAASSAALDLGSAVGGGFASPSEEAWYYLDDASIAQGPYPSHAMRAWLSAGFLGGGTQVLCTTPLPLLEREIIASASALPGAAACESWMDTTSGAPTRFLPLVTLYEHPQAAFLPAAAWIRSAGGWPARYASAAGFDMLLEWACEAGCGDRPTMKRVCDVMASTGAPPDPGILLDVVQRVAP